MIKKNLPKIFIGLVIVVSGILWLISGLKTGLDFGFNAFWPTLIIGIGLAFVIGAVCYNSPGYLYFFGLFVAFGGVFLTAYYLPTGYDSLKVLWPLIIGAPGLASLIMFFVRKFNLTHLKFALFFLGLSAALYIANDGIVGWDVMIPAIVVLVGLILIINIIFRRGSSWDMAESEDGYIPYDIENKESEKTDNI